jgi:hypothetical protein
VARAATYAATSPEALAARIDSLPALDFYVVSRADRRSWRGEDVLHVALTTTMRALPTVAYRSDGEAVPYANARTSGGVVVLLHPAESKGRRARPQAAPDGPTIQDADDGDVGVQYIQRLANGDSVVHDLRQSATGRWMTWPRDGAPGQPLTFPPT